MDKENLEKEQKKLEEQKKSLEKQVKEHNESKLKFEEQRKLELERIEKEKEDMMRGREPSVTRTKVDFNLSKSIDARSKDRIKEILKLSQAKNEKVMRGNVAHWVTTVPHMHISRLNRSINNGVAKVTYYMYQVDDKGNKLLNEHKATITGPDGKPKEIVHTATYDFEKLVVETIEYMKPMKIEEYNENDAN